MAAVEGSFEAEARAAIDSKAKPPGSLGGLEDWAVKLCALQQTLRPVGGPAATLIFAADHGVTASRPVSAYPRAVTTAIFRAIAKGQAASSVLSAAQGMTLMLVDVGVDADVADLQGDGVNVVVRHAKVCHATADYVTSPAMTPGQMEEAIQAGRGAVAALHDEGIRALCLGELGIGNTASAAALLAALSGRAVEDVTGRGTGLDDKGVAEKASIISQALQRCSGSHTNPRELLQEVGGLELAAMVGAVFEASERRVAVLVDGFISGAAALAALRMDPSVSRALFCVHKSAEAGGAALLEALGQPAPPLDLKLRLGEATGAILGAPLLKSAAALMTMASLEEAMS
eukprot:jgi/Tetstr1/425334/TSEL_015783.t1